MVRSNRSALHDIGTRVRGLVEGERRGISAGRSRNSDGFENAGNSDWMFGAFFLVLIIFALSPGVLLTIPPGRGGLLMSGNTSTLAAFVHAILLVVLLNFL